MTKRTTTTRITPPSESERQYIDVLTPNERTAALVEAGIKKIKNLAKSSEMQTQHCVEKK